MCSYYKVYDYDAVHLDSIITESKLNLCASPYPTEKVYMCGCV